MKEGDRVPRILVVDDDDMLRSGVVDALMTRGYRCIEARDGEHALALLRAASHAPDLILLDLSLPALSGSDLVVALRENGKLGSIPVVLMTGWSPHSARGIMHQVLLRKPFTVEKLVQTVHRCLKERAAIPS